MSLDFLGASELAPVIDDVVTGRAVLRRGSKGDAVRYVQERLGLTGADADGDFGAKTEARVKEFQIAKGLTTDGVVGKDTIAAMAMAGQRFVPAPTSAPASAQPAKAPTPLVARPSSVPAAESLAPKSQQTSATAYAAYGFGAVAVSGIAWALFGMKRK
jgi:peptidoglycan hydrolase-like protein with peptidoglycan-binding domain